MSRSKYATVAERDGDVSLFLGKKNTEFSFVKMVEDGDDMNMERMTFNRRALLHLPEQMSGEQFKEFTEGREITDVVNDCLGIGDGDA